MGNYKAITLMQPNETDVSITANGKVIVNGELYVKEQSLYEVIAEVVELMTDTSYDQSALWLTSPNEHKREFAKTVIEKLRRKNEKEINTNSD